MDSRQNPFLENTYDFADVDVEALYRGRVERITKNYEGFVLEQTLDTERYKAFRLLGEGGTTRMGGCHILFHPEGITIQGDWTPDRENGPIGTCLGYGLDWFSKSPMTADYLASKFGVLRVAVTARLFEYVSDYLERWTDELSEALEEAEDGEEGEARDQLINDVTYSLSLPTPAEMDELLEEASGILGAWDGCCLSDVCESTRDQMYELFYKWSDPEDWYWGRDLEVQAHLEALQTRFAHLYQGLKTTPQTHKTNSEEAR